MEHLIDAIVDYAHEANMLSRLKSGAVHGYGRGMRDELTQLIMQLVFRVPLYVPWNVASESRMHDGLHVSTSTVLGARTDHYITRSIISSHVVTIGQNVCVVNFAALNHGFVTAMLDLAGLKFAGDRAQVIGFLRVCELSSR